jgi:hypothetical protein
MWSLRIILAPNGANTGAMKLIAHGTSDGTVMKSGFMIHGVGGAILTVGAYISQKYPQIEF